VPAVLLCSCCRRCLVLDEQASRMVFGYERRSLPFTPAAARTTPVWNRAVQTGRSPSDSYLRRRPLNGTAGCGPGSRRPPQTVLVTLTLFPLFEPWCLNCDIAPHSERLGWPAVTRQRALAHTERARLALLPADCHFDGRAHGVAGLTRCSTRLMCGESKGPHGHTLNNCCS
jgi:hypothetical protein